MNVLGIVAVTLGVLLLNAVVVIIILVRVIVQWDSFEPYEEGDEDEAASKTVGELKRFELREF